MPGSLRTVYAGQLRVDPSLLAALMWHSLVRVYCCPFLVFHLCHFLDDPQMPGLIPLIRKVRPEVPIVYRSHIEIRSDLVHKEGSPQEEVWKYLWNNIQHADLFISACDLPTNFPFAWHSELLARRSPGEQVCSQ
jgi:hypothetical protein